MSTITKQDFKAILKAGIPLACIEILLFLIFYEFFAYFFLIVGALITIWITMYLAWKFTIWWNKK